MRYLLDSTLLIDHANRDPHASALLERLHAGPHELYTCDVVTCEVLSQGDAGHLGHLRVLLDALEYVATTPGAARWAA
ncbi:MAG: type II toxin-antitoxin system VapC family toxin, partial [Candidatus Limnocylindria bacterium]